MNNVTEHVTISHNLTIDNSSYFLGSPLPYGIGSSPHEALENALESCIQSCEHIADHIDCDDPELVREAIEAYTNDLPDEPGELAEIEGWDNDFSEVYWHCVLSFECVEED